MMFFAKNMYTNQMVLKRFPRLIKNSPIKSTSGGKIIKNLDSEEDTLYGKSYLQNNAHSRFSLYQNVRMMAYKQ